MFGRSHSSATLEPILQFPNNQQLPDRRKPYSDKFRQTVHAKGHTVEKKQKRGPLLV